MPMHFDFPSLVNPAAMWPLLADAAVKGIILLSGAWGMMFILRRTSAALRHLVWVLAVCGTLGLPVLCEFLPGWRILPAWAAQKHAEAMTVLPPTTVALEAKRNVGGGELSPVSNVAEMTTPMPTRAVAPREEKPSAIPGIHITQIAPPSISGWRSLSWQTWTLTAWAVGVLVALLPAIVSLLGLLRLGRRAEPIESASWHDLLGECADRLQIRHHVVLLRGRHHAMPMTWGIFSTRILLPPEAEEWADDRRRVVLMHELAHVKRRDFLTQLIVHVARSIYWFNPLIWIAARQIAMESEGACDDLVLTLETRASDYAEHLLVVASRMSGGILLPVAAVAMARSSRLEGRLLAILDERRNRRTPTAAVILTAAIVLAGAMFPLAMARAVDREDQKNPPAEVDPIPADHASPGKGTATVITAHGGQVVVEHDGQRLAANRIEFTPTNAAAADHVLPAAEKRDGGIVIDARGSVAPYDRKPREAASGKDIQPVPVVFSVAEGDVQAIVRKLDAHQAMPVDVYDRDMRRKLGHGTLTGIDDMIDAATGTLKCKAVVIPIDDALLFPNQFLNVRVIVEPAQPAAGDGAAPSHPHREVLQAELEQAKAEAALQQEAFRAGTIDGLTLAAAQDKVAVLEAELTGDPKKVAEVKLAGARRKLELSTKLYKAGLMTAADFEKSSYEVEILEAELAGDPVKVAEVVLVGAQRQLEMTSKLAAVGAATSIELEKARSDVAVAEAKLHEENARAEAGKSKDGGAATKQSSDERGVH